MILGAERERAMTSLVRLLRHGLATDGDADEMLALLPRALSLSGVALLDDWSYAGWARVVGVDPAYGKAYESVRHQDRSQQVLREVAPGTFWCVRRDAPREDFDTDLFRVFDANDLHDLALFRLPNAVFGNMIGCFFRHKGLPSFDSEDLLLFDLLLPHLAASIGTRRALASLGPISALPAPLGRVRGHVHVAFPYGTVLWTRRARRFWDERVGPIGASGIQRIERALHAAIRRLDAAGAAMSSQTLLGDLRLELSNVAPGPDETRRVLVAFVDDAPQSNEEDLTRTSDVLTPAEELLSPRERAVARLTAAGFSAVEIASRLGIGEMTVRQHRKSIFRRLSVTRGVELARLVGRAGPP